jgi:hypothetical protein
MSTTPTKRSSAARMTRHRERRRQGTRCVTVDVSQSERDALVVRATWPKKNETMAPHSKRRLRSSSPISSWTYSPNLPSALELASDRSISETRHGDASLPRLCLHSATALVTAILCPVRGSSLKSTAAGAESSIVDHEWGASAFGSIR